MGKREMTDLKNHMKCYRHRQWQQYQENFMRNLIDARFKNKYRTQENNLQKRPIHELKVDRQDSIDFDRQMTNTCESLLTRIQ